MKATIQKQNLAEILIGDTPSESEFWRECRARQRRERVNRSVFWLLCTSAGLASIAVVVLVCAIVWSACNGGM